ncbi:MAG: NAD(P)-binding protein [Actinomycetota bacterium]|nr:NAD(P)-binding protein [Actinomycetota bacterium]
METVIIGAGVAGLSLGYFLRGRDFLIFEKKKTAGGYLKPVRDGDFFFDLGVRCIHDEYQEVTGFVEQIVGISDLERGIIRIKFYLNGGLYDLPFEFNLGLLPLNKRIGYLSSFIFNRMVGRRKEVVDFRRYAIKKYGRMADWLLIPHSEKTWAMHAEEIDYTGVLGKLIPPPHIGTLINSLFIQSQSYGFHYLYPRYGMYDFIQKLSETIGDRVMLDSEVASIDPWRKIVRLRGGDGYQYRNIISTIPLPNLMEIIVDIPEEIRTACGFLNFNCMANIGIELSRRMDFSEHYIMIPEKKYLFHRITFPRNFSDLMVPEGKDSIIVEISIARRNSDSLYDDKPKEELVKVALRQLEEIGLIKLEEVCGTQISITKPAYILTDLNWRSKLGLIGDFLKLNSIRTCGRFAEWKYLKIDDTILEARRLAGNIIQGTAFPSGPGKIART